MSSISILAATLRELATSGMKPKELLSAVRERHPESSKKEVVRAAFYALTEGSEADAKQSKHLHDFAIGERGSEEEAPIKRKKLNKTKRGKAVQEAPLG